MAPPCISSSPAAHVFGLDDAQPAQSLFTCVREMYENALDACALGRGGAVHNVLVSVVAEDPLATGDTQEGCGGNLYRVRVVDDGVGWSDRRSCGAWLSTSRRARARLRVRA